MPGALLDIAVNLLDDLELQAIQLGPEIVEGHEHLQGFGPPGAVFELLWAVGFEQEDAPWFEGRDGALVDGGAEWGWEVGEDRDHGAVVPRFGLIVLQVGMDGLDLYAPVGGEGFGFVERHLAQVDGDGVMAFFCEVDGVAPLAIGQEQDGPWRQAVALRFEEVVGR